MTLPQDYSRSKYGDAIAETADAIVGDGFADATLGDVDTIGHYALVTLGQDAALAVADRGGDVMSGSVVIIRTDSQGFVDVYYGPAHPLGDPPAYRALLAEWASLEDIDGEYADGDA